MKKSINKKKRITALLLVSKRKLGKQGDQKQVSRGYFKNFLEPKGYAALYNEQLAAKILEDNQLKQEKHSVHLKEALDVKNRLEGTMISFIMRTSGTGVLYSSISKDMIIKELKNKVNYDYKDIEIEDTIKKTGVWYVTVDIFQDIFCKVPVLVETTEDSLKILENKFKKGEVE